MEHRTNSKALFRTLVERITTGEDRQEIESIVYLMMEKKTGLSRTRILSDLPVSADEQAFDDWITRSNRHEPIQYILGECEFLGRNFKVDPSVLIPRPETELLVQEVIRFSKMLDDKPLKIIEVGTGSGCIAISLALELVQIQVVATDISPQALKTAATNAELHQAQVTFLHHNVLVDSLPGDCHILVSNPPYIAREEALKMDKNVLDFEPPLALFVDNDDPLLFYKVMADQARSMQPSIRGLFVEINERFGEDVCQLFKISGFEAIRLIKDLDNKDRMVAVFFK